MRAPLAADIGGAQRAGQRPAPSELDAELRQMGVRLTPEQQRLRLRLEQSPPLPHMPPEEWGVRYQSLLAEDAEDGEDGAAGGMTGEKQRAEGGIFFTPPALAERVVATALAPVLETAHPARPPRVLDPACGAGAFLFAAWRVLERWALRWYRQNQPEALERGAEPGAEPGAEAGVRDGGWHGSGGELGAEGLRLPASARRRLLGALIGMDRDPVALALARRGLRQLAGLRGAGAPSPGLICGDSLIADWPEAEIIVGNPPWVRASRQSAPVRAGIGAGGDLYLQFVAKTLDRLGPGGRAGLILSNRFLYARYAAPLRERITAGQHLLGIEDLGAAQHFDGASTYTCLLYLSHDPSFLVSVRRGAEGTWLPARALGADPWPLRVGAGAGLEARLAEMPTLGEIARIFVGVQTSADRVYHLPDPCPVEPQVCLPLITARDVRPDRPIRAPMTILFPYRLKPSGDGFSLIPWEELRATAPRAAAWLLLHRADLEAREGGRFRGPEWYRFGRHQNLLLQAGPKLCVPRLCRRLGAGVHGLSGAEHPLDERAVLDNTDVVGVRPLPGAWTVQGALALINTRLLSWYFLRVSPPFRSGYHSANRQYLERVPVLPPEHAADLHLLGQDLLAGRRNRAELDREIEDRFGLTAEERAMIREA